jgi:hypothetical protein
VGEGDQRLPGEWGGDDGCSLDGESGNLLPFLIPILSKMPGGRAAPGAGPHQTSLFNFDSPVRVSDIWRLQSFVKRLLKASLDIVTTGAIAR